MVWCGEVRYRTTPYRTNWYHTDMIILVGGEKGGTGKSTVATNLAVWLALEGRDVIRRCRRSA